MLTTTETVGEIMIVLVAFGRSFGVNAAPSIGLGVDSKGTGDGLWKTRCAAVANEVALVEQFDEFMVAMALNRT